MRVIWVYVFLCKYIFMYICMCAKEFAKHFCARVCHFVFQTIHHLCIKGYNSQTNSYANTYTHMYAKMMHSLVKYWIDKSGDFARIRARGALRFLCFLLTFLWPDYTNYNLKSDIVNYYVVYNYTLNKIY